jgi:hemerythrin
MPIVWRPQLSVGNPIIDRDHQYLICLINSTELILRHPEDRDDVDIILDQLQEYAEEHFEREEGMQLKVHYPGYNEHKGEHQRLLRELGLLRAEIKTLVQTHQSNSEQMIKGTVHLTDLLRDWLLNHVVKSDIRMKGYLDHCRP